MWRPRTPRSLRARILLVVVVGTAIALGLAVTITLVTLHQTLQHEAARVAEERAEVGLGLVRADSDGIEVLGASSVVVPSGVWVFDGPRAVSAPLASSPAAQAAASDLGEAGRGSRDIDDPPLHLEAVPIVVDGKQVGTVVGAVSLVPFDRAERITAVALLLGSALVLLGLALTTRWALKRAIAPVDRMTADVAQWSEQSVHRRFALGEPHDEITRLARTLDELMDRIDASLRRERRLTAEISHELRTPVAGITAEVDLALLKERSPEEYREALERAGELAQRTEQTIGTLISTAHEGLRLEAVSVVRDAVADAIEEHGRSAEEAGVQVEDSSGPGLRVGIERSVARRILGPVLENAVRHASSRVDVDATRRNGAVLVRIVDDGPGVAEDELERIFEPAVRGSAASGHEGAGLGLALARRLARGAGGDVRALPGPGGRFEVELPSG